MKMDASNEECDLSFPMMSVSVTSEYSPPSAIILLGAHQPSESTIVALFNALLHTVMYRKLFNTTQTHPHVQIHCINKHHKVSTYRVNLLPLYHYSRLTTSTRLRHYQSPSFNCFDFLWPSRAPSRAHFVPERPQTIIH
jgi:hypothetical protein